MPGELGQINTNTQVALATDIPVFGTEYNYISSNIQVSTTGPVINFVSLSTSNLSGGTYRLEIDIVVNNTNANGDWEVDITEGVNPPGSNTSLFTVVREESIDGALDQRWPRSISGDLVISSGIKNINIEMTQYQQGAFNMFYGNIRLYKISV